ncbi:MAG: hypothetical protein FWD68_15700 [Alphaproteobacteria bacterium]|nr:hypothetical protein [Alphaproteobacteria bacterium]
MMKKVADFQCVAIACSNCGSNAHQVSAAGGEGEIRNPTVETADCGEVPSPTAVLTDELPQMVACAPPTAVHLLSPVKPRYRKFQAKKTDYDIDTIYVFRLDTNFSALKSKHDQEDVVQATISEHSRQNCHQSADDSQSPPPRDTIPLARLDARRHHIFLK